MVLEAGLIFLVLPFIILVVATLFVLWLFASIARGIARLVSPRRPEPVRTMTGSQFCPNPHCRTENPPHARFCRRCGQSLPMLMKVLPPAAA